MNLRLPLLACSCLISSVSFAANLAVPSQYSTIQGAIDSASNGDVITVAPGTYLENLLIKNKSVTLVSALGAEQTIVDGRLRDSVLRIENTGSQVPIVVGFKFTNGSNSIRGGGVSISSSNPILADNIITANKGCSGAGLYVYFGAPTIFRNQVTQNLGSLCSGGNGGGIYYGGDTGATGYILQNLISDNTDDFGGGITLFAAGKIVVQDNVIRRNTGNYSGGGMWTANGTTATILNNTIYGNHSNQGGGLSWLIPGSGSAKMSVSKNHIYDNIAVAGDAIYMTGFFTESGSFVKDNFIESNTKNPTIYCDGTYGGPLLIAQLVGNMTINSAGGPVVGGTCKMQ